MPMEEMHYVAVRHSQYIKNIEKSQDCKTSQSSSKLSEIE